MRHKIAGESIDRRQFIRRCAASAFCVNTLPHLVGQNLNASAYNPQAPGFGSAKHVIFIMVAGGLTQVDTFDPKRNVGSPTNIIKNKIGEFTDAIPLISGVADRMCVIRSMTGKIGVHSDAMYFMRTAYKQSGTIYHPMLGAYAQEILGPSHEVMPSTVSVNRGSGFGNGFLPTAMSPLPILDPEAGLQHSKPERGIREMQERIAILDQLDSKFQEDFPDKNIKAYSQFYNDSVRLMAGKDVEAFDLTKEPDSMREAYGDSKFGQGCLLARRLVETGVRFVEVVSDGWDFHNNLDIRLAERAPTLDKGVSQLILDLEQRGLLDETLVVVTTEFGRKPTGGEHGRGHFPTAFSAALAGAGVKRGFIYGATEKSGRAIEENPVTAGDLHATIGYAMGIRPGHEVISSSGRPFRIGDRGRPVLDLMA
ncbi:MAG: DUF1501 domain-containing protein [Verrucomicrobiota bacterium]